MHKKGNVGVAIYMHLSFGRMTTVDAVLWVGLVRHVHVPKIH